jgi:methyltransferase (TIGR00027 family)
MEQMKLKNQIAQAKPSWMMSSDEICRMNPAQADLSAVGCAMMRYVESKKSAEGRLFFDPYAKLFLTDEYIREFYCLDQETHQKNDWLLWLGALREKYIDEFISRAIDDGVRQLVLLGSGFDCRALRLKKLRQKEILVYEIDRVNVIQEKKRKILENLKFIPSHIRFVVMDLHTDDFGRLVNAGFVSNKKSLFVAQALSYYLGTFAMEEVFFFVKSRCVGQSKLIFDYVHPKTMRKMASEMDSHSYWDGYTQSQRFCVEPQSLKFHLIQQGFRNVINVGMRNIENRYTGRITLPFSGWYIVSCEVPAEASALPESHLK